MRFLLGLLLGYRIRGKKPLLIATLSATAFVAFVCSIVLPAIALSILWLDVMRERASRPLTNIGPRGRGFELHDSANHVAQGKSQPPCFGHSA
jgi:hypothetical protein